MRSSLAIAVLLATLLLVTTCDRTRASRLLTVIRYFDPKCSHVLAAEVNDWHSSVDCQHDNSTGYSYIWQLVHTPTTTYMRQEMYGGSACSDSPLWLQVALGPTSLSANSSCSNLTIIDRSNSVEIVPVTITFENYTDHSQLPRHYSASSTGSSTHIVHRAHKGVYTSAY